MIQLLVFQPERFDNSDYDEDAAYDLSMFSVPFVQTVPAFNILAENLRSRLQLTAEHRTAIREWLEKAKIGDVLLMPRAVVHEGGGPQPDDIGMVIVGTEKPKVYRASITKVERVETVVVVDVKALTTGTKKVKKKKK